MGFFSKLLTESIRPLKQGIGALGLNPETPNIPTPPSPVIGPERNAAAEASAQAELEAQRKRKSKQSTVLTGGLGLPGEAPTKKPTVLGTVG